MSDLQTDTGQGQAGVTASEAYLAKLCRRAFLQLWSYPNLFKKPGKELCDLLVVFGNDVLIFSDKHCALRTDRDEGTAWRRWYRDAVVHSARQAAGAERWLKEQPQRVFTDSACTQPFPINLPEKPNFHRILTCRGAAAASRSAWGGTGSLFVTNALLESCLEEPFHLGAFDETGRMFHVFDEVALDIVLAALDTTSDFCRYLREKEKFFGSGTSVVATGEEDLLGFYLFNDRPGVPGHNFSIERHCGPDGDPPTMVTIDETFGAGWMASPQRVAKLKADKVSYCWDRLIEKTSHHMRAGTQHFPPDGDVREHEIVVRWMAQANRVQRRLLADSLLGAMKERKRRYVLPTRPGDPLWVFLVHPRPDGMGYEEYRSDRRDRLRSYCLVAKHLNPQIDHIAGIAVEPRPDEMSEDILYMDAREWSPELQEHARQLYEEAGIFKTTIRNESRHWEFPVPAETRLDRPRPRSGSAEKKRKRRAAKLSRRRNRK